MSPILSCFTKLVGQVGRKLRRSQKAGSEKKETKETKETIPVAPFKRVQDPTSPRVSQPEISAAQKPSNVPVPRINIRQATVPVPAKNEDIVPPSPSATSLVTLQPSRRNSDSSSTRNRSDSNSSTKSSHALTSLLEDTRIESPQRPHSFIIPICAQEEIITLEAIAKDIQARKPEIDEREAHKHAEIACDCAKQLFAILAYIKRGAEIGLFLEEGITDCDLPFIRKRNEKSKFALYRKDGTQIKAVQTWRDKHLEKFDRVQWWMTAPVFKFHEHYELDSKTILPFVPLKPVEETLGKRQGGYSEIFPVRIHPAHHEFWSRLTGEDEEPLIAVKQLFSTDRTEFEKEESILKVLGRKNHPHLIKLLATYRQDEKFHLLFPYADANLRAYWEDPKRAMPHFDKETLVWSLRQMTGIANALFLVHNFRVTHPLSPGTGNVRLLKGKDTIKLSVTGGEERYGRHGDIKPENVLWFAQGLETDNPKGVLKIADFGLGRFHGRDSRSKVNPDSIKSSPTYEPPEIKLHQPVSRAYDMWSLGCVYLEFITWILKGSAEIDGFADRRGSPDSLEINNDNFFTVIHGIDGSKAIVKEEVVSWVKELHAHPNCSILIHNLLDITMDGLLVIDSHDRFEAGYLFKELHNCLIRAEKDDGYVLKPAPRPLRTCSGPAALGVPKAHGRSHSVTERAAKAQTKIQIQTGLPKDLVLRNKGTPSFMSLANRGTYNTWPPLHGPKPIT